MGGVIPDTAEELVRSLPGVGRYTAGEEDWMVSLVDVKLLLCIEQVPLCPLHLER